MKPNPRLLTLIAVVIFLLSSLFDPATTARSAGESPSLLFLEEGVLYRYQPGRQQPEKVSLPGAGKIVLAELSRDGQRLVYIDAAGVNVAVKPFKANLFSHPLENTATIFTASLSRNGIWLAYADQDGLKLVNTSSGKSRVVFRNTIPEFVEGEEYPSEKYRKYFPEQWSPDSKWLVVAELYYEGIGYFLFSPAGEPIQRFRCFDGFDWHPTRPVLVGSQFSSGYYSCAGPDGIFSYIDKGIWSRRRVYGEQMTSADHPYRLVSWSPSGRQIAFVQAGEEGSSDSSSQILVVKPNGADDREIIKMDGIITPLKWAKDESQLYFASAEGVYSYDLLASKEQLLFKDTRQGTIEGVSPGGSWLAVSFLNHRSDRSELFLIRTDGSGAQPIRVDENLENSPVFVGWE